jgi:hypothetical protein
MTTTGAQSTTAVPSPSTNSTVDEKYNQYLEYNIILYKKCDQIIILQYIHSIISIILVMIILYVFYTILKNKKNI